MIKYSATNHACYDSRLNYKNLPFDLVKITNDEHNIFMGESTPKGSRLINNRYPFEFELIPDKTKAELSVSEKSWRDSELVLSDKYGAIDFPESDLKAAMLIYRQKLRDYPQSNGFSESDRPIKP